MSTEDVATSEMLREHGAAVADWYAAQATSLYDKYLQAIAEDPAYAPGSLWLLRATPLPPDRYAAIKAANPDLDDPQGTSVDRFELFPNARAVAADGVTGGLIGLARIIAQEREASGGALPASILTVPLETPIGVGMSLIEVEAATGHRWLAFYLVTLCGSGHLRRVALAGPDEGQTRAEELTVPLRDPDDLRVAINAGRIHPYFLPLGHLLAAVSIDVEGLNRIIDKHIDGIIDAFVTEVTAFDPTRIGGLHPQDPARRN